MDRMSIKVYAAKNKLSMFNVVKMIKAGELPSETVEEEGKEVTYILIDPNGQKATRKKARQASSKESLEEKVARLEGDVAILKRELDALKMSIGIQV